MQREQYPQLADPTENLSIIGNAIITARSFGTAPEALVALNALQADLAHESQQRITDIRHDAELGGYYYLLHDGYYEHAEKESDLALLGTFTSSIEAAPDVETGISSFMAQLDHGPEEPITVPAATTSSVVSESTQLVPATQAPSIGSRIVSRTNSWREKLVAVPTRTREIGALALAAVSLVVAVSASNINEGTTARMQTPVAESTENMGPKQPLIFEEKTAETTVVPAAETSKISLSDLVASLATTTTVAPKAAEVIQRTESAKSSAKDIASPSREISKPGYANYEAVTNVGGFDRELIKSYAKYMVEELGMTSRASGYIIGNFMQEAGLRHDIPGGLAQLMGGRRAGMPTSSWQAQVEFLVNTEMKRDSDSGGNHKLHIIVKSNDASDAEIILGIERYERYGDDEEGGRFQWGRQLANQLSS